MVIDLKKLLEIGCKLDRLGFKTLKYINDLRADLSGNPFYIDFGFDYLGKEKGKFELKRGFYETDSNKVLSGDFISRHTTRLYTER